MSMRIILAITVLVSLGLAPPGVPAASLDGSVPMLCALTEARDCVSQGACERNPLPQGDTFWRVNVQQRVVSTLDGKRSSPIGNVQRDNGLLLAQGMQNARVWGLVLDEQTGQLSVTVADADGALVLSGSCIAP
jgi:hypothetical protein